MLLPAATCMPAARTRPPATATSYYVAVQAAGRVALQLLHCPLPLAPGIPTPVAGQQDSEQIASSTDTYGSWRTDVRTRARPRSRTPPQERDRQGRRRPPRHLVAGNGEGAHGLALAAATALGQRAAEERAWMGAAEAGHAGSAASPA